MLFAILVIVVLCCIIIAQYFLCSMIVGESSSPSVLEHSLRRDDVIGINWQTAKGGHDDGQVPQGG